MQIKELAELMNVSESDTRAFVDCLRVWTAKGYTLEQAIERHMQQMRRMVAQAVQIADQPREQIAGAVWDAVNSGSAA